MLLLLEFQYRSAGFPSKFDLHFLKIRSTGRTKLRSFVYITIVNKNESEAIVMFVDECLSIIIYLILKVNYQISNNEQITS